MERSLSSGKSSQARKSRITLKPRQRMAWRMVYKATSCVIVLATIGLVTYFQFAKVNNAYAASSTQLAEYEFSSNLTADAGAIGSPTLTYSGSATYVTGGVAGDALEFTATGKYLEITMSTVGYNNITIQWTGKATNASYLTSILALTDSSSGGTFGSTVYTYTFGSTSWTTSTVTTLGSSFNNSSKISIKLLFTMATKDCEIDNIIISGTPIATSSKTDYFRTSASGNWNSTSTWQSSHDNSTWIGATLTPDSNASAISILNGNTVTVSASVIADQIIVNSGGQLTINDGDTLTLSNGTGTDLDVYGTVQEVGTGSVGATLLIKTGAVIVFDSTGVYQHNFSSTTTQGSIPIATWNTGSTCEIIGFTGNGGSIHAANLNQSFYNFTWNCPNQTSAYGMQALLTTVRGNFTMQSSGSTPQIVYGLGASPGGLTMTIGGNMIISGGIFDFANSAATGTFALNIGGNYVQASGTFQNDYTGGMTLNFTNVNSTFTQSGGTFTSTNMKILVNNGITLTLNNNMTDNTSLIVDSGATLNCGAYKISGSGSFTLSPTSTIDIGSTSGITSSGASGNIQVMGTRTLSSGANYIYNGSTAQNTGSGLPSTVTNLTINNSSGVTLTNTVSVSDTLALTAGILTTNSNQINVTNTAATAITSYSSTSYVNGNLDRSVTGSGSYDYPLGTSTNYEFTNITLDSTTGFTDILGTFTNSNPLSLLLPLTSLLVNGSAITGMLNYGYWTLTPNTTITGGSYTVTIKETGHTNPASDPGAYCVLKRHDILSSWQALGTTNTSTQSEVNGVATIACSGLTSFSQYGGGMGGGTLPIELISFDAKFNTDHVDLAWSTATEINNDYFTISRSTDGMTWQEVLRKPGAGTTTAEQDYSAIDDAPMQGISYYRLTQTDYNGHFVNFLPKAVEYGVDKNLENITIKSAGPNPFKDNFNINFVVPQQGNVDIQISNSSGQLVYKETVSVDKGFNTYSFNDRQALPPGIYIVNMISNGQSVMQKLVKQ